MHDAVTGASLASEAIDSNELQFQADEVPSFGYRTYTIVRDEPARHPGKVSKQSLTKTQIENSFYRVTVRESDGAIIGLFDKELGMELIDLKGDGLNTLQRRTWAASLPVPIGRVEITRTDGPLMSSLLIRRPGSFWPETRITLPVKQRRVEIENRLDRMRMPYVASLQPGETYSFNFPFRIEGSATVAIDNGTGYHRIPDDYLPGSRTDAAVPQHDLVLTGKMQGRPVYVSVSSNEAFYVGLPGLPGVKDKNTFLNSLQIIALQKQDEGDTRDLGMVNFANLEPGLENEPFVYRQVISSGDGTPNPVEQYRAGLESAVPMIATALLPATTPAKPVDSFFSLSAPNVVILAFKPSADGDLNHYTLRLQEIAGTATDVSIDTRLKVVEAAKTSLTEDIVQQQLAQPIKVHIGAHETMTLRLTIPHDAKTRSHRWWEW